MSEEEKINVDFKLEDIPMIIDTMGKLQQENKQLKDNWNKLKEFINLNYYDSYMYSSTIINKMQELESKGDE